MHILRMDHNEESDFSLLVVYYNIVINAADEAKLNISVPSKMLLISNEQNV